MRWGRKKNDSSSLNSNDSVNSNVFLASWISKFKRKGGIKESDWVEEKQRGKVDFPTPNSSCLREGRFYSVDEDDAYWRLSFTDERIEGRRSTGGLMNPLWYDEDDEDNQVSVPSFKSFSLRCVEEEPRKGEIWSFNEMVMDIKKMKEKEGNIRVSSESCRREGEIDSFGEEDEELSTGNFELQEENELGMVPNSRNLQRKDKTSLDEDKNKKQTKKKGNISRDPESRKTNRKSKIRTPQDRKKSRTKLKKGEKGGTMFDCYAVAKSSFNPHQDFRDSMVEMMTEKDIKQPEELEELLACYLTFNCDEYHDIIIKIFRQVWFELNGSSIC